MDNSELRALKDEFQIFQRKFEKFLNDNENITEEPKPFSVESDPFKFNKSQEAMLAWTCINWETPIILLPIHVGCFVGVNAEHFDDEINVRKSVFEGYQSGYVFSQFWNGVDNITVYVNDGLDTCRCFYLIEPVQGDTYTMKRLKLTFGDGDVSYEAMD